MSRRKLTTLLGIKIGTNSENKPLYPTGHYQKMPGEVVMLLTFYCQLAYVAVLIDIDDYQVVGNVFRVVADSKLIAVGV